MSESTTPTVTEYETKDIPFAAFLWCQPGVALLEKGVQRRGNIVFFTFKVPAQTLENLKCLTVDELRVRYFNKQTTVEPVTLGQRQEQLTTLMYGTMGIEFRRTKSEYR